MITFSPSGPRRRARILFHAAALLLWAVAELGFMIAAVATAGAPAVLLAGAGWSILGLLLLMSALRKGAGSETLAIAPPHLFHTRMLGPLTLRRRYNLRDVLRPRAERVSVPPQRLYRVEFDYKGWARSFGSALSASEAATIVRMIEAAQSRNGAAAAPAN
jgi:hypothetical protein